MWSALSLSDNLGTMPEHASYTTDTFILRTHFTDDRQKLFLDLEQVTETPVSYNEVVELLQRHIPGDLLDKGVVKAAVAALEKEKKVENRRIAKALEPSSGRPGRVVFMVKKLSDTPDLSADDHGVVSHSDMHLFDNIVVGQHLVRIYPPTDGVPGKNVLGEPIDPESGSAVAVDFDSETIELQEAQKLGKPYSLLCSKIEGYLVQEGSRLVVREELVIHGGVDYSFGNIDFIGSVRVMGDVRPGFRVKAKKGIEIQGEVEEADLLCEEGDIRISGFFLGGEGGKIISGGEVHIAGVNQGYIEAAGAIHIQTEVLHSRLRSETIISLPKGRLIGGTSYAVCGLEAREIGAEGGVPTEVFLCSSVETSAEYAKVQIAIKEHEQVSELLLSHLGPYAANPKRLVLLKEPFRGKMEKLLKKRELVQKSLERLRTQQEALLQDTHISELSRVNILEALHEQVSIHAGEALYETKVMLQGPFTVEFRRDTGEFVQKELVALECEFNGEESSAKSNGEESSPKEEKTDE
ncbi:MAG: DUF342 domain-containing protein [Bdellovibrionales bacterium]|nr:DUF342 domain-containing protein [Bdellovibrionales bacterium]